MAEEQVITESCVDSQTVVSPPSELTPLVDSSDHRSRFRSTASVLGWEKIGSDDDIDFDNDSDVSRVCVFY